MSVLKMDPITVCSVKGVSLSETATWDYHPMLQCL